VDDTALTGKRGGVDDTALTGKRGNTETEAIELADIVDP